MVSPSMATETPNWMLLPSPPGRSLGCSVAVCVQPEAVHSNTQARPSYPSAAGDPTTNRLPEIATDAPKSETAPPGVAQTLSVRHWAWTLAPDAQKHRTTPHAR